MDSGKTMGDRYREARLSAAQGDERLVTLAGAAEALGVEAPETVGRWERDEATPSNYNVRRMATRYRAPELLTNYCALSCPIGQGRVQPVNAKPIAQIALQLHNASRSLKGDIERVMEIAEDGVITPDEMVTLKNVLHDLEAISATITALQIVAEKMR